MNFHWELRKSSCRRPLKILTEWTLHVVEVRRHELVIGRSPTWAPCVSGTTPLWAACSSAAQQGSISAGRTTWRMHSTS